MLARLLSRLNNSWSTILIRAVSVLWYLRKPDYCEYSKLLNKLVSSPQFSSKQSSLKQNIIFQVKLSLERVMRYRESSCESLKHLRFYGPWCAVLSRRFAVQWTPNSTQKPHFFASLEKFMHERVPSYRHDVLCAKTDDIVPYIGSRTLYIHIHFVYIISISCNLEISVI